MNILIVRLATLSIMLVLLTSATIAGDIKVNIVGIEKAKGVIRVSLYPSSKRNKFPDGKAQEEMVIDAKPEGVSATFKGIDPGAYAISVLHDKNNNGKMDTTSIGFPKEPYGNSGKYTIRKPKFGSSRFVVGKEDIQMEIKLH